MRHFLHLSHCTQLILPSTSTGSACPGGSTSARGDRCFSGLVLVDEDRFRGVPALLCDRFRAAGDRPPGVPELPARARSTGMPIDSERDASPTGGGAVGASSCDVP